MNEDSNRSSQSLVPVYQKNILSLSTSACSLVIVDCLSMKVSCCAWGDSDLARTGRLGTHGDSETKNKMDPNMQAAYQEFMLKGRRKNDTASSGDGISASSPSPKQNGPPPLPGSSSSLKKKNTTSGRGPRPGSLTTTTTSKAIRPIFKALQGRIQDWKDANEQSERVLGSILNLRDRLAWESSHLQRSREAPPSKKPAWEGWGFRDGTTASSALLEEDVELALHHDLLQHERMQGALRGLLSSMAQATDAMGRRLDEGLMMASVQSADDDTDGGSGTHPSLAIMEGAQQAYSFLSEELYRKQVLVRKVLDSCHDGLVDQESTDVFVRGDPRQVVLDACRAWTPRDSEAQAGVDRLLKMA